MSNAKVVFKVENFSKGRLSLDGIQYVAEIKEAIKRAVTPLLDDQSIVQLTLKASKIMEDVGAAVILDEEDTLATVLQKFGIEPTPQSTTNQLFSENLQLFLLRKLTERDLLSYYPPSLVYIEPKDRSKTKGTTKFPYAWIPKDVRNWQTFLPEVAATVFDDTAPEHDRPIFIEWKVSDEEGVRGAFYANILRILSDTVGLKQTQAATFRYSSGVNVIEGEPDYVFIIGEHSSMPVEIKTKWVLSVNDIVETYMQNIQDLQKNLTSTPSVIDPVHQILSYMAHNKLQYGVLSTYDKTWFLRRPPDNPNLLYISNAVENTDTNPTLLQSFAYIMSLAHAHFYSPLPDPQDPPEKFDDHEPPDPEKKDDIDDDYPHPKKRSKTKQESDNFKGSGPSTRSQTTTEGKQRAPRTMDLTSVMMDHFVFDCDGNKHLEKAFKLANFGWSYDVINVLGTGRCGKVFKAIWRGEEVALKLCDLWKHPEYKEELIMEVNIYTALKELQGRIIPKLKGAGYTGGGLFATATEIAGYPIKVNQLDDQERSKIVSALSEIHEHGVLHNDIRAENILIQRKPDGFKISFIDFACSKRVSDQTELRNEMILLRSMLGPGINPAGGKVLYNKGLQVPPVPYYNLEHTYPISASLGNPCID